MGGSTFGKEEIAIHTEHLTRSFDQGDGTLFDAVHDVSLDFPKGKVSVRFREDHSSEYAQYIG